MTYNNYPIQYAEFNLITPNPASDAILEEYNRQFVYHTFCDLPSETEELIVIDAINAFYADEDDDAICQNDPILLDIADKIDPQRQIDRLKLNMLLLERCDGLKVVFIDVDDKIPPHFIIAKDAYTMAGLIGVHLNGHGVEPYFAEKCACEIADDLALTPPTIKAVILEQVEFEELNEGVFDFDIDDFEYPEDIIAVLIDIDKKLQEKREAEEHFDTCPSIVELHANGNVSSVNMDDIRNIIKDVLTSKQEQDSFLRIAAKLLYHCHNSTQHHPLT